MRVKRSSRTQLATQTKRRKTQKNTNHEKKTQRQSQDGQDEDLDIT